MTYDSEALLKVLARFARLLPVDYDVATALDELVDGITAVLGVSGVGVSLEMNGRLRFVTAPDERSAAIERCQEDAQQGPCVDAYRTGKPILVADLARRAREWPRYSVLAAEYRVMAVAGIPMRLGENNIGVVNLYDLHPRYWAPDEVEVARLLSDIATGYVVNANKWRQQQQVTEQLQFALRSRVILEQAKGMIATQHGITPDEAFDLIRGYARRKQARLHAVAGAIVDAGLRV
ncbi:GAF and ANTAR domain-containing protein [Nocardia inohanensis]|uniref:GAF and ANTAR domain-containing protein n=1 Tax=Nocardia inohanensis TaxID=209246 RepID=UPI00082B0E04|nr:GAF and ANTAR domain-containing protein [Nocardia inohanensis]